MLVFSYSITKSLLNSGLRSIMAGDFLDIVCDEGGFT